MRNFTRDEGWAYLGDGVYYRFAGFYYELATMEGNIIYLEPELLDKLVRTAQERVEAYRQAVAREAAAVEDGT